MASYSRDECIADGGHLWPLGASDDEPQTCKRCGYNPGWTADQRASDQSNTRRGCTCADPAYLPDPRCPEHGDGSRERQRSADMIGYGQ